ncbi:protein DnrP [Pseudomonas caricapapayae]|jgi:hypothetical protein|uniref:Protein DnrP n=1 Tax=Pseudomonas caricapapayae TaxID=46678 RepID=A0ACC7LYM9_9PSED|nr:protein DnrP [Pseudomonas sp.]
MKALPVCLYCQHSNPLHGVTCEQCGMPLPTSPAHAAARQQLRFLWFCIGLTLFCVVMVLWLPR